MKQPQFHSIPLHEADMTTPGKCSITMDPGAWDTLLETAYNNGWTLIEFRKGIPVRAYKKPNHEIIGNN